MIRSARPTDAPDLHAVWTPVIRETTSIFHTTERTEEEIAALAEGPDPFLVWDDGEARGFARCFPFRAGNGYAEAVEHTVLLAPEAQGRGVGRALMEALIAEARACDKHTMWGAVSAENAPGLAFHAAMGFTEQGRLREAGRKFGRWLDLVLMGRVL